MAERSLPFRQEMTFDYEVPRVLAPNIRRIVADNPSDLTYKGTNTYLIGEGEVAVIDPGPDLPKHIDAILAAVSGARISHILIPLLGELCRRFFGNRAGG